MELWRAIDAITEPGSTVMKFVCECGRCGLKMEHEAERPENSEVFRYFEVLAMSLLEQGWLYEDSEAYCFDCLVKRNDINEKKKACQLYSQKG